IIRNEFYVYARDINCIDAKLISKKISFDRGVSYSSSSPKNSVRSKLLATHNNFAECLKDKLENRGVSSAVPGADMNRFNSNFSNNSHSSKRVHVEDTDDSVEEFCEKESEMCQNIAKNSEREKNEIPVIPNDSVGNCVSSLSDTSYSSKNNCIVDFEKSAGGDCVKDFNNS
ncbi:4844_t:CDS:1, partial [Cetraspora pellucida]